MGRVKGGIFLHKKILDTNLQTHAVKMYDLWHGRLGHPSRQLSLLAKNFDVGDRFNKKWMNLAMFAFVINKVVVHFRKAIAKLVNFLSSCIVMFGVPIMFHQLIGHTTFCQSLMMEAERYGYIDA